MDGGKGMGRERIGGDRKWRGEDEWRRGGLNRF